MLEKPDLNDQHLIAGVQAEYGVTVTQLTFLPLGADMNTAVYSFVTEEGTAYFLKLRSGTFDPMTVAVPQFLQAQGLPAIIAPLATKDHRLWGTLPLPSSPRSTWGSQRDAPRRIPLVSQSLAPTQSVGARDKSASGAYKMILYPFIPGKNGYEVALTDQHWVDFGAAIHGVHTAQVPPALQPLIQREAYSPHWREVVRAFQAQVESSNFPDPVAAKFAAVMQAKRGEVDHLIARADRLARLLQARALDFVLCHTDIHAGNIHIGADGALYIVDWDNPLFAPKERDLMFIGGMVGGGWDSPRAADLFYQGYVPVEVDRMALAYYRYERVIQDIAAYGEQLLLTTDGGDDREQGFQYFTSNFLPGHEIELAHRTDPF